MPIVGFGDPKPTKAQRALLRLRFPECGQQLTEALYRLHKPRGTAAEERFHNDVERIWNGVAVLGARRHWLYLKRGTYLIDAEKQEVVTLGVDKSACTFLTVESEGQAWVFDTKPLRAINGYCVTMSDVFLLYALPYGLLDTVAQIHLYKGVVTGHSIFGRTTTTGLTVAKTMKALSDVMEHGHVGRVSALDFARILSASDVQRFAEDIIVDRAARHRVPTVRLFDDEAASMTSIQKLRAIAPQKEIPHGEEQEDPVPHTKRSV